MEEGLPQALGSLALRVVREASQGGLHLALRVVQEASQGGLHLHSHLAPGVMGLRQVTRKKYLSK